MNDKNRVSAGRKLWECINPFVFLIVCMILSTAAVMAVLMAISITQGESSMEMYQRLEASTLSCNLVFYAAILVAKHKSVIYDKFRYEHASQHWTLRKIVLAVLLAVGLCYLIDIAIVFSGLTEIATEYTAAAELTFRGQSPFLLIFVVVLIGPIAEELIFRWMIFGRIRFYFGRRWAIIISALLFGLYHGNLVQFVYCTCMGIIFACLYDKSGCIWIPVAAHMVNNFLGVLTYL